MPGDSAPPEATVLARRIFAPVQEAFTAAVGATRRKNHSGAFTRSVTSWTRLHGVLSLELAGHFTGMNVDPGRLYQDEARSVITGQP